MRHKPKIEWPEKVSVIQDIVQGSNMLEDLGVGVLRRGFVACNPSVSWRLEAQGSAL